jgi:arylsulfatase A-like enzyme
MGVTWNILLITLDQWRADHLGAAGHPVLRTPALDGLAADGVLFRRHYTQASPCGPARASLFTGLYLHNHRSLRNGVPLDERHDNLAKALRRKGYDPTLFGYTDTSVDPRGRAPDDPALTVYEGVLPGFAVGQFLGEEPWSWVKDLASKGYKTPAKPREMWLPRDVNDPRSPARFTAAHSDTAYLTDHLLRFLGGAAQEPWCAHISYLRPHPPYVVPEPFNTMYRAEDMLGPVRVASRETEGAAHPWLAQQIRTVWNWGQMRHDHRQMASIDDEGLAHLRAIYCGMISEVDAQVGRVFHAIKDAGQWDRTLVVVTADHGDQLGDHWLFSKDGWFEQSFHIPLVIRDPRAPAAARGRGVDAFTEAVDVFPTVLDWLGAPRLPQLDGRSVLPWLRGETPGDWRDAAHWGYDFRDLRNQVPERALSIASNDCHLTVLRGRRWKYVHFPSLPPLLYDLENDPGELRNLAADPAHAGTVLACAQTMLDWRMRHEDRALSHLHLGPGGVFARSDG